MAAFYLDDEITLSILPGAYHIIKGSGYFSASKKFNQGPDGTYECEGVFNYMFSAFERCNLLNIYPSLTPFQGKIKINRNGKEVNVEQPIYVNLTQKGLWQFNRFTNFQIGGIMYPYPNLLTLNGNILRGRLIEVIKALVHKNPDPYMPFLIEDNLIWLRD